MVHDSRGFRAHEVCASCRVSEKWNLLSFTTNSRLTEQADEVLGVKFKFCGCLITIKSIKKKKKTVINFKGRGGSEQDILPQVSHTIVQPTNSTKMYNKQIKCK